MMSEKLVLTTEQKMVVDRQLEILKRGVVEILPEEEFREKLAQSIVSGKPLKVKLGLDPTAPDIHIGHTVVINKLRQFQELGHQIQLILGDFTARVGDPTGKSETRKQLSEEEVKENAQTYVKQYGKILDMTKTELYYNSEWLSKLNFVDVVQLSATMTVARMLERDDFEKRYKSGQPISVHEFFYPLMQGYDSVELECDIELGGTDQKFNLLMGRHLQKEYGKTQQITITTPLLEGLDGTHKMSKSLGNYIGIDEGANQIYGKAMSIPDHLMLKYFELTTPLAIEDIKELEDNMAAGIVHPRDAKMKLASMLVEIYHSVQEAQQAENYFKTVFQERSLPKDMPEKVWQGEGQAGIIELILGLEMAPSKSEARRLIQQGAVKIDEEKKTDINEMVEIRSGMVIQIGKRKIVKINFK
jgi:tyrosyl-tRNA synthetase